MSETGDSRVQLTSSDCITPDIVYDSKAGDPTYEPNCKILRTPTYMV
jgi:hypothetical protein